MKNVQVFVLLYCNSCAFVGNYRDSAQHHDYDLFCVVCKSFIADDLWNHKCLHLKRVQELASQSRKTCKKCGQDLFSEVDRENHLASCDVKKDDCFECKCCDLSFGEGRYLDKHMKSSKKPPNYTCAVCPQSYNNGDDYQQHIIEVHLSKIRLPALTPLRDKKTNGALEKQKVSGKVACTFCTLEFANKSALAAPNK